MPGLIRQNSFPPQGAAALAGQPVPEHPATHWRLPQRLDVSCVFSLWRRSVQIELGKRVCLSTDRSDGVVSGRYRMPITTEANRPTIGASARWALLLTLAVIFVACGAPSNTPEGSFKSVSTAPKYACAVRTDGGIVCWGLGDPWEPIPNGRFKTVDAGIDKVCGIRVDDSITCWWHNTYTTLGGVVQPPAGSFKQVVTGFSWWWDCALRSDGVPVCWKDQNVAPQWPTELHSWGRLKQLSRASNDGTLCGIRVDDGVECWDLDGPTDELKPGGTFSSVSRGWSHTCAISTEQTIICWGEVDAEEIRPAPPRGEFIDVSTGAGYACGIRTDRSLACWGEGPSGTKEAPSGKFGSVSAEATYVCAIKVDGGLVCWGQWS